MFIGRQAELETLKKLDHIKKASLIVCYGRRRVGKSTLIEKFGESFDTFLEVQGLAPRKGQTNQDQLDHFSKELTATIGLPRARYDDWTDVLRVMAKALANKKALILLDEISWMGAHDPDFPGKLKIVWDTEFKKNLSLRVVLCGSVSSWIEENILASKDFMGRISLELKVDELPLPDCNGFWGKKKASISDLEKFRILGVTGGIPRYLEEIDTSETAEENIARLCFRPGGLLVKEFQKIFKDIFERRATPYGKIIETLAGPPKTIPEICHSMGVDPSGPVVSYLEDLVTSGFIQREYSWDLKSGKKRENLSRFRLIDNYLRFYFRFIEPNLDRIEKGIFRLKSLDSLSEYEPVMGLQGENLVLKNLPIVFSHLNINVNSVLNFGTYFQTQTTRQKGCQIDLLIQTKGTLYVGEIKFRRQIDLSVVEEVREKIGRLKFSSKLFSIRPFLIYAGELSENVIEEDYFDPILDFGTLLRK